MAEAQDEQPGAMAAVIGMAAEELTRLCEAIDGPVAPANFNTPAQIVVSGSDQAVDELVARAADAGADKAVRLQVGAAFHSTAMEPVQERLATTMADVEFADPEVPLVSNASGELVTGGDEVRQALIAQISSPVQWVDCVQTLAANGAGTFLELGPGRVLIGLVRQILDDAETFAADSAKKLGRFKERQAAS